MENLVVQLLCRLHLASHLSTSKSSSSETQAQKLEEFTKAYDAFFVDESKSSLKNDKFGDLENLKKTAGQIRRKQ